MRPSFTLKHCSSKAVLHIRKTYLKGSMKVRPWGDLPTQCLWRKGSLCSETSQTTWYIRKRRSRKVKFLPIIFNTSNVLLMMTHSAVSEERLRKVSIHHSHYLQLIFDHQSKRQSISRNPTSQTLKYELLSSLSFTQPEKSFRFFLYNILRSLSLSSHSLKSPETSCFAVMMHLVPSL